MAQSKLSFPRLDEIVEKYICDLLEESDGNILKAERMSGIPRVTLYRWIKKYHLEDFRKTMKHTREAML